MSDDGSDSTENDGFFFNGTVYDAETNESFRIRGNEKEMRVLPTEDLSLATFMRFHEFVNNEIDPGATVKTDHEH